jgi:hypothetical protein
MKTLLLVLLGVASLSAQCILKPNPDTGLLDCTGGPCWATGACRAPASQPSTPSPRSRQTFAVGTAGTDFNIVSGNQHSYL